MSTSLDDKKADLIERAGETARRRRGRGGPPRDVVGQLLTAYYRHVAPEDLVERSEMDLYGALASHHRLAQQRPQGTAQVRVLTPSVEEHGWSAGGRSVVEVVTDDMPFLVDSVTMELSREGRDVHVVVHPQLEVVRDIAGALQSVAAGDETTVGTHGEGSAESWMHLEISRLDEDDDPDALVEDLRRVLRDVRESVEDWDRMDARVAEIVAELEQDPPAALPETEVEQGAALLRWLAGDHFTFLGYREYELRAEDGAEVLRAVAGTGLGILRADPDLENGSVLPAAAAAKAREKTLLVLTKANSRSTVHRATHLDYVGVKVFDDAGEVVGERRFLGLFSSAAYTESLTRIPLLREKAAAVLEQAGFDPHSHAGKALMDTLENYPRDELFHAPVAELAPVARAVMFTRERRQLRLFVRRDGYGRYLSCLVYLPRDRYNTGVRQRFSRVLAERIGGSIEFNARIAESTLARVQFVVRAAPGEVIPEVDDDDLERRLSDAARSWTDDFTAAVVGEYGESEGTSLARRYVDCFPEAYKEDFAPRTGAVDLGRLEAMPADDDGRALDLTLYEQVDADRGEARLKVFRVGDHLSLSEVLPMLSSMGVEVVDERPYELEGLGRPTHIYEFGLRYPGPLRADARTLFTDALRAVWEGRNEVDGFNALVLAAGLTWRQASVLRAYAKYLKQGGSPFALDYIEEALADNVDLTRRLVDLFEARFDPGRAQPSLAADAEARTARCDEIEERITRALDDVASLDHDRIVRSYLAMIRATLRTNYFQVDADGAAKPYLSLKIEPSAVPDLPEPRPRFEIFVHSPRVEGVHLRFGPVARGGLRWSDRRDDFRTEVLGLVKAQMVKNSVIVPVGAKGGFFAKQLPDPGEDREAWLAEGKACYRSFISGLLDITDNLVDDEVVPPERVVRHDGDDAYLVVAADKGTATFSDLANEVAHGYGFWLGDAFASGGSVGYDHKAMGITARGAWVSVRRHFRERGIDCQVEDHTAVGVGDMSGDVFGNGMLCSEHTRLVAAFDHRDVFIDPDPDTAAAYAERQRLFDAPRSSWQDYDTSLISEGGGVWSRSAKSIPVSRQVREALRLDDGVTTLTPQELIRAILLAPVDLLWNGGIGTYVKAGHESHAEVGDKANDAIRVDGREVRARCVGEGGNLGLTQAGRIEYARAGGAPTRGSAGAGGGRINSDFIDNSAGVDTSDHEVNIKILLDKVVVAGDLTGKQRNTLLATMTDEVGELVLADNYEQNVALANASANAAPLLHVHEDWMRDLERRGVLNRVIEGLPTRREVRRRAERGQGLTVPELSVLMCWTKIVLADELLGSDLPDDPHLRSELYAYFPDAMRQGYRGQMEAHPLRREIVVTQVVNQLVNGAGMTFWHRLAGETGASAPELVRANLVAREVFGSLSLRSEISALDNVLASDVQTHMRLELRTLVERATRWFVTRRRSQDSEETVERYELPVRRVMERLPELMGGRDREAFERRRDALVERDVDEELATRVAVLPAAYALLDVVDVATEAGVDPVEVTRVHFALGERLGLPALLEAIAALPREDRWQTMARAALRDDLHGVQAQITGRVLEGTDPEQPAPARVADWEERDATLVQRASSTLEEITAEDESDLARVSVALRVVRGLLTSG